MIKPHSDRVGRISKSEPLNPDLVRVGFSPEVLRSFARLEAMVHDSAHFSPEILENLQELASGKQYSVSMALSEMALITKNSLKHIQATGDKKAQEALDSLISNVMGLGHDETPITLLAPRTRSR